MSAKTKLQLETELMEAQATIAKLERDLQKARAGGQVKKPARKNPPRRSQSEEDLLKLLEVLPVGVSILDDERKVVFQNSALSHILDMTPEGIQTGAYKDRKYLAADGSAMPADGYASMQAQTSGQAVYNVETGVIKENGETIWTSVSALPVNLTTWKTVIVTIDITERKNAEVRMREAELLYRTIFETSLDGLTVFDSKMNITISNKRAAQIYGFDSPAAMVGRNAFEFLPPDEQMRARENARNRRADHVHYDEYRLLRHDGQEFFGETGLLAIPTQEGTPSGLVLGVVRDITERKRLEKNLHESEERYTILFEKTAVPSILLRLPEVVIVDVNEACERLTGFSKQEMLGKTAAELGIIKKEQRTEAISQFEKHGSLAEKQSRAYTKSGEERIVVANTNRVMINEQPFAITTLLDITGRKQAEIKQQQLTERLDLAARSAHIGIWDWDIQKNEIVWDDQMYALYGLKAGEFGGAYEAWLKGVHPDDREPGNEISAAAVRGEREYDTEFRVLWPDGSVHWLKANGQVYRDENGTPLRMVGVNYDITERKQAEAAMEHLHNTLVEAQKIAHLGSFEYIAATQTTVWSEEEYRIYGLDPSGPSPAYDVMLQKCIYPDDAPLLHETFTKAMQNSSVYELEHRIVRPDGSVRWVYDLAHPHLNKQGELIRYVGITLDITERKLAEEKIRESEEFLRLAYEATNLGIWKNDLITGSVEFDERARMHYGFDTQQTTLPELMTHIHPDDVARLGSEIAAVTGPTGDGKFATEYRVIHPDGSVHWLAIGVRVIFEGEGEKRHSVMGFGTSLDITERKLTEQKLRESEERFRIALRNSPIVIFNQDRDLRYTWIYNPAMGFSQEAVLGKTDAELLHVEDAAVLTAIKHHVLITGIPVREEFKSTLNGQTFFYDLSVEPMRDLNGTIIGVTCVSVDITERKQAEEALKNSQAQLEALVTSLDDIVFEVDMNGTYLNLWTGNEARLFRPREEIIGKRFDEVFGEAASRPFFEFLELTLSSNAAQTLEYPVVMGGEQLWYAAHYNIIHGQTGMPQNVSILVRDITARKQAEEALRQSQENFAKAFNLNPTALAITRNADGSFLNINNTYTSIMGYERSDIIGHKVIDFPIYPDMQVREKLLRTFAEQGRVTNFELTIRDKRQILHEILVSLEPIVYNNEDCILSAFVDITELKKAQQDLRSNQKLLQAIIDNTPALVYTLDLDGRFLLINRPLEKLFGHTNAELIGHGREEFIPHDQAQQHRANDLEIFQSGEWKIFEEENMEPDGRHVYLSTKFPLRDANGFIYAICGISTDMTEQKLMEEELRRSNAELEQFAYIASHDLQEPLRALSGMVQLLQKRYQGQIDEQSDEYIKHAVDASARMQALIQALLTYSRAQRNKQPIELVDAGHCLQTAINNLNASIQETHTVVTTDPLPHVHADPVQLTQLFQNLIGNAIKFRRDVEPQIHISVMKLSDAWQFSVRDNGIGIEPQYFERIFLIFQRLHTRREYPGTGIGLALCKKIIERHGGRIWVESEPEHGSVFHFTIPLRSNS